MVKSILFLFIGLFLFSCDIPEEEKQKAPRKLSPQKREVATELPWRPPLISPTSTPQDFTDLPAYLRPRPSRFSKRMWSKIQKFIDTAIQYRRHFHTNPELAHREVKTGKYITEQLSAMGLKSIGPVGLTGVAMLLTGDKPGPTIGLLAGLDGIPAIEKTGLHFASKEYGYWENRKVRISHGFGKDMEISILMGTAQILSEMKSKIAGNIIFIFQPASSKVQTNEKPGAEEIISSGILRRYKVEALFTLPLDPGVRTGRVGVPTGAVNGGLTRFSIKIQGTKNRICSGSVPWKCLDPIGVGAHMVQELLMIPGRRFGPNRQVILNVGSIHGGEAAHLMAPKVVISGTFRWLVPIDRKKMARFIKNLTKGTAKSSGTKIKVLFTKGPQLTVGHSKLTSWSLGTLVRSLGKKGILPADPLANPGDFPIYHKELPTAMFLLGCSKKGKFAGNRGSGNFNPDEEAISVGIHLLSNLAMDFFTSSDTPRIKFRNRKKTVKSIE
jgi:amidohydrolase